MCSTAFVETTSEPPKWIKPLLTRLVDEAPSGSGGLHEIKYDGYRMHARIDGDDIKLLTRTGLDWSPPTGRPSALAVDAQAQSLQVPGLRRRGPYPAGCSC
jgi:ATP-dependent DNA ligase